MYMSHVCAIDLTSFANCRQRLVAFVVVERAINVSIHVDAVLVVVPVVRFVAVPVRVPQRCARHGRYKISLRSRVTPVDVYRVDTMTCCQ